MVAGTVANGVGEGVSGSVLPVVAGTVATRGEANMLKILPIILFHSAHKLSLLFL